MDRLDTLRLFAAVAEKGSFAEAARAGRVSPAAASRAIAELERELGVPLFRRTTRSVGLTSEGAAYLESVRTSLELLDEAGRSLRGADAEPRGEMVVTAPVVFGRLHILPLVTRLIDAHPGLNVRLMLMDRVVRLVDEGIDVAVRIADLSDSALHALRVAEVRRVLVASPAYLERHGAPANVAQLHDHALIAFDTFAANGEWRFGPQGRPAIHIAPRLTTNSVDAAIDAAIGGFGIARTLCYQVERHIRDGRLVYLLPELDPPPVPVSLVYLANRQASPNVRTLINEAKAYFRDDWKCSFASAA
jgi:DNA-binding transcriptional LysR family regulator